MTRLVVVGGFLGSGKTTLLIQAAQRLQARGLRVGVITNDQAGDLVDTAMVRAAQVPVVEVVGGCFCCRFPDLWQAIDTLLHEVHPDIILAEPVGSCTDLVATIVHPIRRYYADSIDMAPLSVLVDPTRDWLTAPTAAQYLYQHQLREAQIVVLSKTDVLSVTAQQTLIQQWRQRFPHVTVVPMAAHDEAFVDAWLELVVSMPSQPQVLADIDYAEYAQAEAALGWLNATLTIVAVRPLSLAVWLATAAQQLALLLAQHEAWVAHVKLQAESDQQRAKVSLLAYDQPPQWDAHPGDGTVIQARVMLNVRVAISPVLLQQVWQTWLTQMSSRMAVRVERCDVFAPAPPQPTYRFDSMTAASEESG